MSTHAADPPNPIPTWLAPIRAQLGEGDLRIVTTLRELAAIVDVLEALELSSANVMLTHRDGSPWIEIDAVAAPEQQLTLGELVRFARDDGGVVSLALWRYTLAVYRVVDGAVEDEPLWRPGQGRSHGSAGGPAPTPSVGPATADEDVPS